MNNKNAKVHWHLCFNWVNSCPQKYFNLEKQNSLLKLLGMSYDENDISKMILRYHFQNYIRVLLNMMISFYGSVIQLASYSVTFLLILF